MDLIDRQRLKDDIAVLFERNEKLIDEWLANCVDDVIDEQPSADVPERKVGEWIWMGDKGDSRWMCSVCKSKENVPTIMGKPIVWDYCPNCSARMKTADNERDYERAIEQMQHDMLYEKTYNSEDGSM